MKQDEENSGYPQQDVRGAILQPDSPGGRRCCAGVLSRPLADSLVRASHWKRARPLAEQLYRRNPDDAQAAYLLSQVKMAFGDLEGALPLAGKGCGARRFKRQLSLPACGGMWRVGGARLTLQEGKLGQTFQACGSHADLPQSWAEDSARREEVGGGGG